MGAWKQDVTRFAIELFGDAMGRTGSGPALLFSLSQALLARSVSYSTSTTSPSGPPSRIQQVYQKSVYTFIIPSDGYKTTPTVLQWDPEVVDVWFSVSVRRRAQKTA